MLQFKDPMRRGASELRLGGHALRLGEGRGDRPESLDGLTGGGGEERGREHGRTLSSNVLSSGGVVTVAGSVGVADAARDGLAADDGAQRP